MRSSARNSLVIVVVILVLGAVFIGFCRKFQETPQQARTERREAANLVRQAPPDAVVTTLVAVASQRKLRTCFLKKPPFVSISYGRKIPADYVAGLAEEIFIRLAHGGYPDENDMRRMRELLKFAEELSPECSSEEALTLRERQLDAHFLVKDYDGTIAMLQQGLAGRSTNWLTGTIAKLRAHKAVDGGQWAEALKQFTIFGKCLQAEPADAPADCDPSTGIIYCRDWMLAKNYNRCSGLYTKLSDRANALTMLNLAKEHYTKALEETKDDAKSLEVLKAEVKPLGL